MDCFYCGGPAHFQCGGCLQAPYCNKQCQSVDFPDHYKNCDALSVGMQYVSLNGKLKDIYFKDRADNRYHYKGGDNQYIANITINNVTHENVPVQFYPIEKFLRFGMVFEDGLANGPIFPEVPKKKMLHMFYNRDKGLPLPEKDMQDLCANWENWPAAGEPRRIVLRHMRDDRIVFQRPTSTSTMPMDVDVRTVSQPPTSTSTSAVPMDVDVNDMPLFQRYDRKRPGATSPGSSKRMEVKPAKGKVSRDANKMQKILQAQPERYTQKGVKDDEREATRRRKDKQPNGDIEMAQPETDIPDGKMEEDTFFQEALAQVTAEETRYNLTKRGNQVQSPAKSVPNKRTAKQIAAAQKRAEDKIKLAARTPEQIAADDAKKAERRIQLKAVKKSNEAYARQEAKEQQSLAFFQQRAYNRHTLQEQPKKNEKARQEIAKALGYDEKTILADAESRYKKMMEDEAIARIVKVEKYRKMPIFDDYNREKKLERYEILDEVRRTAIAMRRNATTKAENDSAFLAEVRVKAKEDKLAEEFDNTEERIAYEKEAEDKGIDLYSRPPPSGRGKGGKGLRPGWWPAPLPNKKYYDRTAWIDDHERLGEFNILTDEKSMVESIKESRKFHDKPEKNFTADEYRKMFIDAIQYKDKLLKDNFINL